MVTAMMLGIIIVTHPLIVVSAPKDKDSESSNKAPEGCYYKGQYHHGNWEDGCKFLCTCLNPHTGYYKCRRRCPRYKFLPENCILIMPRGGKCCKQPACFRIRQQENQATNHLQLDKLPMGSDTFSNTQFDFMMRSQGQGQGQDSLENPRYSTSQVTDKTNGSDGFRYSTSNSDSANSHKNWQTSDTDNDTQLSNRTDSSVDKKPQSDQKTQDHSDKRVSQFELSFRTEGSQSTKFGTAYLNKTESGVNVTTADENTVSVGKTIETADLRGNNSDTDTTNVDKADNTLASDSHSNDTESLNQGFYTTIDTTQSYLDQEISNSTNNIESNSSGTDPEIVNSNSDSNEQSSGKKPNNATYLETTGNIGHSIKDDQDTSETDKTIIMRRQRLINFILRKGRHLRKIQTLQKYFVPSVRNLNRSIEKRNRYKMPPQNGTTYGHKLMPEQPKFQTSIRSHSPVEKSRNKTLFKIPDTIPMPRNTESIVQRMAEEKRTTIGGQSKLFSSSTVTYKPIIPIYTRAPNVSLRYKEKEWGVFVTELHEMFLEVNRLKKLYTLTTPSQIANGQGRQKTRKSRTLIQKPNITSQKKVRTTEKTKIMRKKPTRNTENTKVKDRCPSAKKENTKVLRHTSAIKTKKAYDIHATSKPNIIHSKQTLRPATSNVNLVRSRGHFYGQKRLVLQPYKGLRRVFRKKNKQQILSSNRTSRNADCFYQGHRYKPGQIWTNRCNKTCICSLYFKGQYWCQQERCLMSTAVPRGCRLRTQRTGCCRVLDCTGLTNSSWAPKNIGKVDKLSPNNKAERTDGYKNMQTPTGVIPLKNRIKTTPKWFGSRLSTQRPYSEAFCRYKGRKYVTGEVWTDGCNSCQCVNGMLGRYTCHVRCPSYNKTPSKCSLSVILRHRCCSALRCSSGVWKAKKTSSIKKYHEDRFPTTTQRNIAIYPFVQTFFVPKIQTTETPFARERKEKKFSAVKNNERLLESVKPVGSYKSRLDTNKSKVEAYKTRAAFNKRWRSEPQETFIKNRHLPLKLLRAT